MSNSYELKGRVLEVGEIIVINDKFQKRLLAVETDADSRFPQQVPLEFIQDSVTHLDRIAVGDNCTIQFNIRGREHAGKYYANLVGWRIQKDQEQAAPNLNENSEIIPF